MRPKTSTGKPRINSRHRAVARSKSPSYTALKTSRDRVLVFADNVPSEHQGNPHLSQRAPHPQQQTRQNTAPDTRQRDIDKSCQPAAAQGVRSQNKIIAKRTNSGLNRFYNQGQTGNKSSDDDARKGEDNLDPPTGAQISCPGNSSVPKEPGVNSR